MVSKRRKFDVMGRLPSGLSFWRDYSSLHMAQIALRELEVGRIIVDGTIVKQKGEWTESLANQLMNHWMAMREKG